MISLAAKQEKASLEQKGNTKDKKAPPDLETGKKEVRMNQGKESAATSAEPPKSLEEYKARFSEVQARDPFDLLTLIAADRKVDQQERAALLEIVKLARERAPAGKRNIHQEFLAFAAKVIDEEFPKKQSQGSKRGWKLRSYRLFKKIRNEKKAQDEQDALPAPNIRSLIQKFYKSRGEGNHPLQDGLCLNTRIGIRPHLQRMVKQLEQGGLPLEAVVLEALRYDEQLSTGAALSLMLRAGTSAQDVALIQWFLQERRHWVNDEILGEAFAMAAPYLEQLPLSYLWTLARLGSNLRVAVKAVPSLDEDAQKKRERLVFVRDKCLPGQLRMWENGDRSAQIASNIKNYEEEIKTLEASLQTPDLVEEVQKMRARLAFLREQCLPEQLRIWDCGNHSFQILSDIRRYESEIRTLEASLLDRGSELPEQSSAAGEGVNSSLSLPLGFGPLAQHRAMLPLLIKAANPQAPGDVDIVGEAIQRELDITFSDRSEDAEQCLRDRSKAKVSFAIQLLDRGFPLRTALELLPQCSTLAEYAAAGLGGETLRALEQKIIQRFRAGEDLGFSQTLVPYLGNNIGTRKGRMHCLRLLKGLRQEQHSTQLITDCIKSLNVQEIAAASEWEVLAEIQKLSEWTLENPELSPVQAEDILRDLLHRILVVSKSPASTDAPQLVSRLLKLARERQVPEAKMERLIDDSPDLVADELRRQLKVATSMAELLDQGAKD